MSRPNIFHNLVKDENSTTELLCNAMRYAPFRHAFLALFLSASRSSQIADDDIETQVRLDQCKPDLVIDGDDVCALVEVKVEEHCRLTANQPDGYFNCLLKDKRPERWLVFLVPRNWFYLEDLKESLRLLNAAHIGSGVQTCIVYWEVVLDVIETSSLQNPRLSAILHEFAALLSSWFLPRPIMFSKDNIRTLFSKDFAIAFSDLLDLIKQVGAKGRMLCKCSERGIGELYFKNADGEDLLWVGFWPSFWKAEGTPLCFGVHDDWSEKIKKTFREVYGRQTKSFEGWTVGWMPQEDLESSNALEKTWQQVNSILQAMLKTNVNVV